MRLQDHKTYSWFSVLMSVLEEALISNQDCPCLFDNYELVCMILSVFWCFLSMVCCRVV